MTNIYRLAKDCADVMSANITKQKNRIHSGNLIFIDYDILGDLKQWETMLQNLCAAMSQRYHILSHVNR